MKKIILISLFVILVLVVGCETIEELKEEPKESQEVGFAGITQEQCEQAGGYWNECGSPCAGTDAEVCIQMCQVQCECGGIEGFKCQEGYKCRLTGKIVDEMGVCVEG